MICVVSGSDAELLSSGVASDFGCFYDRHVRAVTAFAGSWIGETEVVFDLVAERFARALEHRLPRPVEGAGGRVASGDRAQFDGRFRAPGAGGVGQSRAPLAWDGLSLTTSSCR